MNVISPSKKFFTCDELANSKLVTCVLWHFRWVYWFSVFTHYFLLV